MSSSDEKSGGRPTKYQTVFNDQVYKLALLGATDAEIADFFEVSESTINLWKKNHHEFSESIREGKIKADYSVAHKLYDKAIGPQWIEEQAFKVKKTWYDNNGKKCEEENVVTVPVKRAAPPDTPAISLWLRNRKADKWREKVETEHSGDLKISWTE